MNFNKENNAFNTNTAQNFQNHQNYNPQNHLNLQNRKTTITIKEKISESPCNQYCWMGVGSGCFFGFFGFFGLLCISNSRNRKKFCKGCCGGVFLSAFFWTVFAILYFVYWFNAGGDTKF